MPVLAATAEQFSSDRPFDGLTIGFRLHIEPKTAILIEALQSGGATVVAMGNEGTTQFATADVLRSWGCTVLDQPDDDASAVGRNLASIASHEPDLVLDNGAELIAACARNERLPIGATEETTSGAFRLREEYGDDIRFPVIVINDSPLKSIVENKHGVGESVIDTIVRATNLSLHKKRTIVFGYGWCGRGIALYARSRGADVCVVEIDPVKALEAAMDGFDVSDGHSACQEAELVITATGRDNVVCYDMIEAMPDGVLLANAGHVETEIDVLTLSERSQTETVSPSLVRHTLANEHVVFVLAEGRIVNLAAEGGIGNPIEAMDLGLTLQAQSLAALLVPGYSLKPGPQPVPDELNQGIARAMLTAMGQRTS